MKPKPIFQTSEEYYNLPKTETTMELKDVKTMTDIKQGDTLIITSNVLKNEAVKAQEVKFSHTDGTDIIIDKKHNRFFNLGMYLKGKSWVKECKVVK